MKAGVTGAGGQLGHDVKERLLKEGYAVSAPTHTELDITDRTAVAKWFETQRFDVLIHCAAWTNVDLAEENVDQCRNINVDGTAYLVEECARYDIPIVYISTDYVFNGSGDRPWEIDNRVDPVNQYGRSKYDGERIVSEHRKHFIIRISWVFGINGKNFVKTMIRLSEGRDDVRVVADQFGSPTYTYDLAALISSMIKTDKFGTYHAHNEGYCSWYDFAREIFLQVGSEKEVMPISSDQFPMKAQRPKNSRMSTQSLIDAGFALMPHWKDALERYVQELHLQSPKGL